MIPQDKFGRAIYPNLFRILKDNGEILSGLNYKESVRKQNLFYLKTNIGCLFADMRGTKDVALWEDPRPLFYWRFEDRVPSWERRRLIKNELKRLFNAHCPCRLSFYFNRTTEFENTCSEVDDGNGTYDWDDGFCSYCGKDFKDEGSFCSTACRQKYEDSLVRECEVCGRKVHKWKDWDSAEPLAESCAVCNEKMCLHNSIAHHISYFPEELVLVHRGCHIKIHRTDKYPSLKPKRSEIERFYKRS